MKRVWGAKIARARARCAGMQSWCANLGMTVARRGSISVAANSRAAGRSVEVDHGTTPGAHARGGGAHRTLEHIHLHPPTKSPNNFVM